MVSQSQPPSCKSYMAITGAAGGLGKAFAVECASRGWNLLLTDLTAEPLETLTASLRSTYQVQIVTHACDLTDPHARAALFARLRADGLRFWALANIAGIDHEGFFLDQSSQQIRTIVRLNIEGTLDMTHALLQQRGPNSTFRVINVASLAAFSPMPVKATYAASKRFLLDFSLALREELREQDVTVTVLCPAGMPTNPECIQGIQAQGWLGQITTRDVGRVAYQTVEAALAGRALVIPGRINQALRSAGSLLPASLLVRLVGSRWKSARQSSRALAPEISPQAGL